MTKYFTAWDDFDVDTIGTNIAGWTVRGAGASTRPPAYGLASVVPFKRRYLAFTLTSSAAVTLASWDRIDTDADRDDFDALTCFIGPLATVDDNVTLFGRGAGTAPFDCYMGVLSISSNLLVIQKLVASASTTLASAAFTVDLAKSYFVRFQAIGTTLKLKAWDAALGRAGEPAAWNVTVTDATFSAAGSIGLGDYEGAGAGEVCPFNLFAVGTNGDSAVCPRTNTEYTAWLASQTATRAVVAKMRCTGYDSSGSPYTATRKVYLSNYGYTSHQQDSPSLQPFDNFISGVPAISREMPAALSGQATVNFGRMKVTNPAVTALGTPYLLLDGASGCYASTPDSAANSITGDIDLRCHVAMDDWTPAAQRAFLSKMTSTGNQVSYVFAIGASGVLIVYTSPDGTNASAVSSVSTAAVGAADGTKKWVRVTLDVNDGAGNRVARFYTSDDGVTWTQLGSTVTTAGVTTIFDSTSVVTVSGVDLATSQIPAGKVYRAQIYNGIAGTLAVDFNLTNVVKGTTSFSGPTGEVWTINGTAKIRQADDTLPGARDDWLRIHWLRDGFELLMGDPSWPLHDFRHVIRGRLGTPTAPSLGTIEFPIADMSEFLEKPLTTTRYSSGDMVDLVKARLFGQPRAVELIGDRATLVYSLSSAALSQTNANDGTKSLYDFTPSAAAHIGTVAGLTVSSVNTGTGAITASANHGMIDGYRVPFISGTPPLSLSLSVNYWVVGTTPGTAIFKLSLTQGGAAITGGGAATGAGFDGYGYTYDLSAGTVTLAASPAGRIVALGLGDSPLDSGPAYVSDVMAVVAFTAGALSLNYKDAGAFSAASAVDSTDSATTGYATHPGNVVSINEVLTAIAGGCRAWYGFSPTGLLQTGSVALPAASAVMAFGISEIAGNLSLSSTIRTVDFSKASITYAPWFTVGGPLTTPGVDTGSPFQVSSIEVLKGRRPIAATSYGAAGVPIDNYPTSIDGDAAAVYNTLSTSGGDMTTRLVEFHKQTLGIFSFDTRLPALEVNIGDTISLDFPRLGWKQYTSADPASPDNTATIDARLAVVIGHYLRVNQAGNSYDGVGLKVFRRIPGYYPTGNLN